LKRRAGRGAALALCATLSAACAHGPGAEALPTFAMCAAALPRDSASAVPFEPARLRGKVVLVTFIATWCFPCLAELATLDKLQRDYGAQGFQNVLVGMDLEGRKVLEPFAANYELRSPLVVSTPALRDGETPFGRIRELPTRVLFDRDGQVVAAYAGVIAWPELQKAVTDALGKKER
jgi:thiol-disulfide isomerase/thioredoxin